MKHQKIVKEKGRIILIANELREPKYWSELLESLTFAEGLALGQALQEWSEKNVGKIEVGDDIKSEVKDLKLRLKKLEDEFEDFADTMGTKVIV